MRWDSFVSEAKSLTLKAPSLLQAQAKEPVLTKIGVQGAWGTGRPEPWEALLPGPALQP